ncbi:MAG: zinc-binding dehydrogenase [Crocinitomicaceae bacterium]
MKAIFLTKTGDPSKAFEIRETEKPQIGPGEVLIKVAHFGLNYADVLGRLGIYPDRPPLPCVLGYEVAGKIEEIGEGVDPDLLGKNVAGFTRFGGYAEYAKTLAEGVTIIQDESKLKESLGLITQGGTAYYCSHIVNNLFPGDIVLVHAAAGGVGSILVQLAKNAGCTVIGTCGSQEKVAFVKDLGADHVINYQTSNYWEEVEKLVGKKKVRVTFNAIAGKSFKKDMSLLEPSGSVVLFGASDRSGKKFGFFSTLNMVRQMGLIVPISFVMKSTSVIGVNMLRIGDYKTQLLKKSLDDMAQLQEEGKIKIHLGGEFKVDEIAKAHELLGSRKSKGKIIVSW